MDNEFYKIYPYIVPTWASHLKNAPSNFVKLFTNNTPIHKWKLKDVPDHFDISIKRDDLTGTELSGNKVRNLQILFADALIAGARHVITGGGTQSGNCRAVSIICRALGLKPHIVIEGVDKKENLGNKGNTLLYRIAGSEVYLVPNENYECFKRRVRRMALYISEKYNENCYCIPVGAATVKGVFGSISAFEELLAQDLHNRFDDIVVTMATGGTALGLAVGNYLTGSKLRIHAVSIALKKEALQADIDRMLIELGLEFIKTDDILDIVEGYVGDGYGTVTEQVLNFVTNTCCSSGILLDPYYTAKGTFGMVEELKKNPTRFKGTRILFIHTGGIFGLFNGEMDRILNKTGSVTNNIIEWPDELQSPLE